MFAWRDYLQVHPAAELFPPIAESELKELAEDIKKYGLHNPIIAWRNSDKELMLVDGRNRLDALATLGLLGVDKDGHLEFRTRPIDYGPFICAHREADPYAVALSHNIHRRHLTLEQKRDLIAELLKLQPEKSNRQIADVVKADHKTVGSVRSEIEATGEIPQLKKTTSKDGKSRPAKKVKPADPKKTAAKPVITLTTEDYAEIGASTGAEKRKQEYSESERKAVSAKDNASSEFDAHVLRLLQMTKNANPGRFARTGVPAAALSHLGHFLKAVAAEVQP
jgi:hypothetical protein